MAVEPRFEDVSELRQVPDHQEVLVDPVTEQSVIVEIVELVPDTQGASPAHFHFSELAKANSSALTSVDEATDPAPYNQAGQVG